MCRVIGRGGLLLLQVPTAESEYFLSRFFRPYAKYIIGKEHKHIFTKIWLPWEMKVYKDEVTDIIGGLYWLLVAKFYNMFGLDSKIKIDSIGQLTFTCG